jgi:exodeoxyribonuclease VII large subunit
MTLTPEIVQEKEVLTVHQLNQTARQLLEGSFQLIWIKGELSNVALPPSGHIYFTLKDARAQVRCALFKGNGRRVNFTPKNGQEVLLRASVSIYEERGDYQLIVTHMEQWGAGALQQAFEALKAKLQAEGLFDPRHKKPLPKFVHSIGIISSRTGAALQDILSVLKRRYPLAPIVLYHTQVQGKTAAASIVKAIQTANQQKKVDAIILARGGGSLEDLWCFN